MLKVDGSTRAIIDRLKERIKTLQPDSQALRTALTQIGVLLQREMVVNARRQGIIDSGRLINSIRYEFFIDNKRPGILVGSFGVPYAAINEFGGPFTDRQRRAMFAALARQGKLKSGERRSKNVIQGSHWRARPYIRPAVTANTNRVIEILRKAAVGG